MLILLPKFLSLAKKNKIRQEIYTLFFYHSFCWLVIRSFVNSQAEMALVDAIIHSKLFDILKLRMILELITSDNYIKNDKKLTRGLSNTNNGSYKYML